MTTLRRLLVFQFCLAACWLLVSTSAARADSAAPPTFSPPAGTYAAAQSVTISTTTAGASIRYTTDSSTPSDTEGTLYAGPVTVSQNTVLKAIAYASGLDNSTVNSASYTILGSGPFVGSLWPPAGSVGTLVTLTGANFGSSQGSSTVAFNGTPAGTASFWNANIIRIAVPSGAASGNVVVTVDSVASNARAFTVASPPTVTTVSPSSGAAGTSVTISGSGFGSTPGTGVVWLGSTYGTVSSWSDTEIVATVATGSNSGLVQVRQAGVWSNAVTFDVIVPAITSASPSSGPPGTQVTITGTGFGSAQGDGQVWLGTANGTVQSWGDTEIVVTVASTAASGQVQVLQNGVWSSGVPFDVDRLHLSTIDPASGAYSTSVTFTGTGFGATQGSGKVWLGSVEGTVVSWSDTEIVATVAYDSLTGVARVQQDSEWSNALAFTVPSVNAVTLVPNLMNLEVGDTHTIQALDSTGQPVTGLTWASSDTNVVSLSVADPPVLTAVAAGRVTITAGTASADVTVSATALPPGTVLWSNPGAVGSAVLWLAPAVPSSQGVADVFAFHEDGTVVAVTAEGTTAWAADVNQAYYWEPGLILPDFQGGLVYVKMGDDDDSVVRLDGLTGQPTTLYTVSHESSRQLQTRLAVHPDGTIFVVAWDWTGSNDALTVMGFDPAGGQKFSVTLPLPAQAQWEVAGLHIVAGDGNAYVSYSYSDYSPYPPYQMNYLKLLRVSSDGASEKIDVFEWSSSHNPDGPMIGYVEMITNADEGALVSWTSYHDLWTGDVRGHMAMITGGGASAFPAPGQFQFVKPMLQLEDGSFVGTALPDVWGTSEYMIAFDATGSMRWSVPGYTPKIATADGGVLATDASGSAVLFDENGSAVGMTAKLPTQSWLGHTYRVGSTTRLVAFPYFVANTFWAWAFGNSSGNAAAVKQEQYAQLDSCSNPTVHPQPTCPGTKEAVFTAWYWLKQRLADPARATALDTYVFQDLTGATRQAFQKYLGQGAGPEFYDGTKSYVKLSDAQCGGAVGRTVQREFGLSNDANTCLMAALTCRLSAAKPLRTFFEPRAISLDSGGLTDANLALQFHEAMHGFKQMDDPGLQSFLGCTEPVFWGLWPDTRDITLFLQQFIGAQIPSPLLSCVEIERSHMPANLNVCVRSQ